MTTTKNRERKIEEIKKMAGADRRRRRRRRRRRKERKNRVGYFSIQNKNILFYFPDEQGVALILPSNVEKGRSIFVP